MTTPATPTPAATPAPEAKPTEAKPVGAQEKAAEAPKEPPRRHKVKVDDQEVEVDEAELLRGYSHSRAANKKFEEAAATRKQAEDFLQKFLEDPIAILENPNVAQKLKKPLRQLMEERLAAELRKEIDPEAWQRQQEQNSMKSKAEAYDDWKKEEATRAERAQLEKLEVHYAQEYDRNLKGALEAANLPKTTQVVRRAAQLMQVAIQNGYDPDLQHIVAQVREEYHGDTKSLYGHLSGEDLIRLFGEDIANKIRKADLARLRKPAESKPGEAPRQSAPREQKKKERLNPREFLEAAMKRANV